MACKACVKEKITEISKGIQYLIKDNCDPHIYEAVLNGSINVMNEPCDQCEVKDGV